MKLTLALALLGTVAAFSVSQQQQHEHFNSENQQLRYRFVSQVLTGIPELNSQYAGVRLTGEFVAQRSARDTLKIQLQQVQYANFNRQLDLQEGWDSESLQLSAVPSDMKQHLETPFKVVYQSNGQIKEVQCESSDPELITNIKKSLTSSLSFGWLKGSRDVDTNMIHRNINQRQQQEREPNSFSKTTEKTFQGLCEVEYSVNKLPEYQIREFEQKYGTEQGQQSCEGHDYYEVVKSINYEKCSERPIYQRTVGAFSQSDKTQGQSTPFVRESDISKTVWCGTVDQPIIRRMDQYQKVQVEGNGKFESQEKIEVRSKITCELIKVEEKSQLPQIQNPETTENLTYSYPTGDFFKSSKSARAMVPQGQQSEQHLPQPDMTSAPVSPYPRPENNQEAKEKFVQTFIQMLELSKKSPESSSRHGDVLNQAANLALIASTFSYDDLNDCWSKCQSQLVSSLYQKQTALNVFCDVLSMSATNPSVKFISEKLKNGQLEGETGSWIAANMIRSVRTPTEQVIQELTSLLQNQRIQGCKLLRSTISMTLTQMVHKACVDETSSVFDFPTSVYGQFCTQNSRVIKKELIPFLQSSLYQLKDELRQEEPSPKTMNKLISLINALGNLGMEEASKTLLEVVEGKLTSHSHPRSVAVYKLIRSAARNPTKYRQVIIALIQNNAENEEVRMAAVSALPYCSPSSADLQKMAVMTWFDSSKQVASYISSTLQSLKDMPLGSIEQQTELSQKAEEALKLAKPYHYGIQTSQNLKIKQILDTLKASVGMHLQYVNSEESAIPRNMYIKSEVNSRVSKTKQFETSVYVQGADKVIEKVQDLYKMLYQQQQDAPQKQAEQLQYEARRSKTPEAHVTLKMFDMQRLFTVDAEALQEMIAQLSHEMSQESESNGIKRDYLKVLDLSNHLSIIPTAAGLPLYIKHVTPLVITSHTSIMMGRNQAIEIKSKPVMNYMQSTSVGTFCPISKQYLGTGAENSIHVTIPLRADVRVNNGQVSVTLRTPEDQESQKNKAVFDHKVTPYTIKAYVYQPIEEQKKQMRTIHTESQYTQKEYQLGRQIGVDLKAKIQSDRPNVDFASIVEELSEHKSLTWFQLPIPLKSVKSHRVSLYYSPSSSQTKEASFVFTVGHGSKLSSAQKPKMDYPQQNDDDDAHEECRQEVRRGEWDQEQEIQQQEEQERKFRQLHSQQQQQQMSQQQQEEKKTERKHEKCMKSKSCGKVRSQCERELREENRPHDEIEKLCKQKQHECQQVHQSKMCTKTILYRLRSGSATTFSASLTLKGEQQQDKKLQAHVTLGQSSESQIQKDQTELEVKCSYEQRSDSTPYDFTLMTSANIQRPASKWNKQSMLSQNIGSQINIQAHYGQRGQQQESVTVTLKSSQSQEQKQFAQESQEARKCQQQNQQGEQLTEECKQARSAAASLDQLDATVKMPSAIAQNKYVQTVGQLCKAMALPYITKVESRQQNQNKQEYSYDFSIKIDPRGQKATMKVEGDCDQVEMKNIRIPQSLQGLLPINVQNTDAINILQKLTNGQAPSTCSIENGKQVKTFDNVEYQLNEGQLNNCEHVIFKDCSEDSKVQVSVQQQSSSKKVKVMIDNHVYEVEIPSGGSGTTVKVNGQEKKNVSKQDHQLRDEREREEQREQQRQYRSMSAQQQREHDQEKRQVKKQQQMSEFVEQKHNYYSDKNTYVTSYQDGVYAVVSNLYGIAVYCEEGRIQVQSYQHMLRNRACGLCGDLNDEKTADVKSAGGCIMSSNKLASYSYMIQGSSCQGIPSQDQQKYNEETQQCLKKETVQTPVTKIYEEKQTISQKHLSEEKDNKICISKERVNVCQSNSSPQEITQKKVQYFCISKDTKGAKLQRMAEQGDLIQGCQQYPTSFERTVSEPKKC